MAKNTNKIMTLIGAGAELNGDFNAPGSARIDGTVNGNVTVEGLLVLGTAGVIVGNVTAESALIGGSVEGDVVAPTRVEMTSTSRIIGNLTTQSIVIDEHAIFQGNVNMNQEPSEKRAHNASFRRGARAGRKSAAAAVAAALKEVNDEENGAAESSAVTDAVEEANASATE